MNGHTMSYGTSSPKPFRIHFHFHFLDSCAVLNSMRNCCGVTAMSGRPRRGRSRSNAGGGSEASQPAPEAVTLQQVLQQVVQLLQQQQAASTPATEPTPAAVPPPPATPQGLAADIPVPEVRGRDDGILKQFLELKAPTFSGGVDEDPTEFLREMNKRFELLRYEGPRRVEMVGFLLQGLARNWFDMVKGSRPAGVVMEWEEFQDKFLIEFLPDSLREQRAYEFEGLTYVSCGSVDVYVRKFLELCTYAPALVVTDKQKARRFMRGLPMSMQEALVSQVNASFAEVVDQARRLERIRGGMGGEVRAESNKKARTEPQPSGPSVSVASPPQRGGRARGGSRVSNLRGTSSGVCYNCSRPGHMARDCREETVTPTVTCFVCGKVGHYARNCEQRKSQGGNISEQVREQPTRSERGRGNRGRNGRGRGYRGRGRGQRTPETERVGQGTQVDEAGPSRGQARVYAMSQQDADASNTAITGTLFVGGIVARVLFDSGATHSFLSPRWASCLIVQPKRLDVPLIVSTPLGEELAVELFYPACDVVIEGHRLPADLVLLELLEFDVILGMDWLSHHHATLVCREKAVRFFIPGIPGFFFEVIGGAWLPASSLI